MHGIAHFNSYISDEGQSPLAVAEASQATIRIVHVIEGLKS